MCRTVFGKRPPVSLITAAQGKPFATMVSVPAGPSTPHRMLREADDTRQPGSRLGNGCFSPDGRTGGRSPLNHDNPGKLGDDPGGAYRPPAA
jgi:hypothetical protein